MTQARILKRDRTIPLNDLLRAAMNVDEDFAFHGMVSIHLRQKRSLLEGL